MLLQLLSVFTSLLTIIASTDLRVIYVDPDNGAMDPSCWMGGMNLPCKSYDLAAKGALYLRSLTKLRDVQVKPYRSTHKNVTCRHFWMHKSNGTCKCGDNIKGSISCSNNSIGIRSCSCMTFDVNAGVLVGSCPYGCGLNNTIGDVKLYHSLPRNVSRINNAMCGWLKRDGRLCGSCKKGYSSLVYSYELYCVKCNNGEYNWLKFIAAAFLPLTIFYFVVILFRINATNPYLYGFITINQGLGSPINLRAVLTVVNGTNRLIIRLLALFYSIWNLDFFRSLPLNICLDLTTLQTLALDYAIAVYPLILTAITYFVIELHASGCRIVLWLWSPFHRCCVRFTRIMDIQSSIIKAFATFFLLSYVKLINSTLDMLLPVKAFNVRGKEAGLYVYYDASYKYFGKEHLPYAIMAIVFFLTFVLIPLVLLLCYQISFFQRFLNACRLKSHVLQVFVDTFQGHYKDGTEPGTRDYRWFAAVNFLIRIIALYVIFGYSQDGMCYSLSGIILISFGTLTIALKPYKKEKINAYHACVLLYLAATTISVNAFDYAAIKAQWSTNMVMTIILTLVLVPIIVVVVYVAYYVFKIVCYKVIKASLQTKQCCKESRMLRQATELESNAQEQKCLHSTVTRSYLTIKDQP